MKQTSVDTRRIILFLVFAFGIAWAFGLWVYLTGGILNSPELLQGTGITLAVALIALGYMWAPALANILTRIITKEGWKDAGLRPQIRKGWWALVAAWFSPAILTFLGVLLYFAIFRGQFDPELGALRQMMQAVEAQAGEAIPFSLWTLVLLQLSVGLLVAPLINSFFTFGEELGWRGYLQPKLMVLGFRKALLLTGVIWGIWHWPVIAMGHNFGFDYWGAPWTGFLMMTWFTITAGTIIGWLALRGQSVWPAVIAHAATNGIAGAGLLFLRADAQVNTLLGPAPVGLIANIPWALLAVYLLWKGEPRQQDVSRETTVARQAHSLRSGQAPPGEINSAPASQAPKGAMIYAHGLGKDFGKVKAVEGLDLEIPAGEVFGLLGPNGAGKTTTIRMLSALIAPSAGEAWVAGHRVGEADDQIRRNVGILTETPGLYEQLSAERNLAFFAQMYDVQDVAKQVERYLRMLGLWGRRSEAAGTFSKGMRQKLAIARALLHEPEVLFLDEPTSSLDPESAHLVRDFISELGKEGRTIILCTHNLDEADRLCDRVAVFKTRLLAVDTPTNLRRRLFGRAVVFHLAEVNNQFTAAMRQKKYVLQAETVDNKLIVKLDDPERRNPELVRELIGLGAQIQFVGEMRQSLEDVYLQLMGSENEVRQ